MKESATQPNTVNPAGSGDESGLGGLEESGGAVVLFRPDGEVFYLSRLAREAFGRLGVGVLAYLDDLPPQLRDAVRASAPQTPAEGPEVLQLLEGVWGVKLPMEELDPEWLRGMVEAEQMAAVGQLAATVAQEIGGPNTSIQVAVDHLLEGPLGQEDAERAALRKVLDQTDRITKLTRQLISLADPGRAQLVPLDVEEIAQSACELMSSSFLALDIELESDLQVGPLSGLADRNHLLQALVNLLLNARGALQGWEGERKVRVRTEANTERIYLHIEDSGPGIPPEETSRIFLPFISTTGGTGMGLFLTRQILVEQRGGIRVQSRGDLGGATFTIYLEKATDE